MLRKKNSFIINSKIAQNIGRDKHLKILRNKDFLFIGHDRKKHKTVIAFDIPKEYEQLEKRLKKYLDF